jgi:hypothetical protein
VDVAASAQREIVAKLLHTVPGVRSGKPDSASTARGVAEWRSGGVGPTTVGTRAPQQRWHRQKVPIVLFYRGHRRRFDVLMDGADPAGGRWNYDTADREPPPKQRTLDVARPWLPDEQEAHRTGF